MIVGKYGEEERRWYFEASKGCNNVGFVKAIRNG